MRKFSLVFNILPLESNTKMEMVMEYDELQGTKIVDNFINKNNVRKSLNYKEFYQLYLKRDSTATFYVDDKPEFKIESATMKDLFTYMKKYVPNPRRRRYNEPKRD